MTARLTAIVAGKLSAHSELSESSALALEAFLTKPHAFPAGATIADIGDPADLVTFVHEGYVARCASFEDGRRQIQAILIAGDAADLEATLLSRRTDRIAALTRCSVWLVPKSRLSTLPAVDTRLAEALAREAMIAVEIARQWIVNIGRRSAYERIAHLLSEIGARLAAVGIDAGRAYVVPLRQQDLADAVGISMVHANRVFQALKANGAVEVTNGGFRILNPAVLHTAGSFDPAYLHLRPVG